MKIDARFSLGYCIFVPSTETPNHQAGAPRVRRLLCSGGNAPVPSRNVRQRALLDSARSRAPEGGEVRTVNRSSPDGSRRT